MTLPKDLCDKLNEAAEKEKQTLIHNDGFSSSQAEMGKLEFKNGATWMFQAVQSMAGESFDAKDAIKEFSKYEKGLFCVDSFIRGARWQHSQDRIKYEILSIEKLCQLEQLIQVEARVKELEECLKEVIRNSHDIAAKKLCSVVLHGEDSNA